MKRDSKVSKFLSIVVTLAMVVSLNVPISAWAVEGDGGDEGSASSAQPAGGDGGNESQGEGLTLQDSTSVALVDDAPYETLQEAIAAAGDNATVVLTSNTRESVTVEKEKSITLDLGEYTLTAADGNAVTNDGTLTVTATSGGVVSSTQGKTALTNNGTATIQGGNFSFEPVEGANDYYVIENHGDLSISGGSFANLGSASIENPSSCVRNGWDMPEGVSSGASKAKLTISGGSFTGGSATVKNDYNGYLNISDGTFTNEFAGGGCAIQNYAVAKISGGVFVSMCYGIMSEKFDNPVSEGDLTVTGGMVNVTDRGSWEGSESGISVVGGTAEISDVSVSALPSGLAVCGISVAKGANVTIKGVTVQDLAYGIQVDGSAAKSTCTIEDSTVKNASDRAIVSNNGSVTVNGGKYEAVGESGIAVNGYGGSSDITINDGEFTGIWKALHVSEGIATVYDGTFAGEQSGGKQKLYGGRFINAGGSLASCVAKGFAAQPITSASGETTYVVVGNTEVAKVGDATYYNTLSAAIAAVANNGAAGEITLQKSVVESVTIPANSNITLNLNGKTITNKDGEDTITVALGGTLTVTGDGTVDNVSHQKAAIYNNGTANLSGGSYTRSAEASISMDGANGNSYYNILNHGQMTINEGVSVVSSGAFSSLVDNGYYNFSDAANPRSGYVSGMNQEKPSLTINGGFFSGGINTIKNDDNATVTINGGTFENVTQAVVFNANKATITGGTFNANGKDALNNQNYDSGVNVVEATVSGGTFNGKVTNFAKAKLSITSGTFNGSLDIKGSDVAISGGNFANQVPDAWCADGFRPVADGNGRFTVEELFEASVTNSDGTAEKYKTLAEAVKML